MEALFVLGIWGITLLFAYKGLVYSYDAVFHPTTQKVVCLIISTFFAWRFPGSNELDYIAAFLISMWVCCSAFYIIESWFNKLTHSKESVEEKEELPEITHTSARGMVKLLSQSNKNIVRRK